MDTLVNRRLGLLTLRDNPGMSESTGDDDVMIVGLSVGEVAKQLRLPSELIKQWLDDRRIVGEKPPRQAHWRVRPEHVPSREAALKALREDALRDFEKLRERFLDIQKDVEAVLNDVQEAIDAIKNGAVPPIGDDLAAITANARPSRIDEWMAAHDAVRQAGWLRDSLAPEDLPIDVDRLIR